jgi:hypothetical protein
MKKIISTTLLALFLSAGLVGCAIKKEKIDECEKMCAPNGGIDYVKDQPFSVSCQCVNGMGSILSK